MSLLIMAVGIGSRFGGGVKQLESASLQDEIIMDYAIHDAMKAGFNKIIFVIRKNIKDDSVESICKKQNMEIAFIFQGINDIPGKVPLGRTKTWGTEQAVLTTKDLPLKFLYRKKVI